MSIQNVVSRPLDIQQRLAAVRTSMRDSNLEAVLVYKVGSEAYAYGGQGYFRYVAPQVSPLPIPPAIALVTADGPVICVMYRGLTELETLNDDAFEVRTCEMTGMTRLRSTEITRVAADALRERVSDLARLGLVLRDEMPVWLVDALVAELPTIEIVDATEELDRLMMIKTDVEIERVAATAELADAALEVLFSRVAPGATEAEIVADAKRFAYASGAEYADIRLATNNPVTGKFRVGASSLKRVETGDHLHVGMDISMDGYWANIVRRGVLGKASTDYRDLYEASRSVYHQVVDGMAAGRVVGRIASEAAQATKTFLDEMGVVEWEAQRLGHGIGLENQERPFLIADEGMSIATGMTFAVHPGVLVPRIGQAAVGNIVAVGDEGAYSLTQSTDSLTEID